LQPQRISYAKVALDVPLARLFDYAAPSELQVRAGDRVMVPFGARQRVGVVMRMRRAKWPRRN
jgi:primosomal protein N' (replication factor Y) (superfamily II helicase)